MIELHNGDAYKLIKNIPDNSIAVGVPTRVIENVEEYKNKHINDFDYTKALNETKNVMSTGGNFTKAMQTNLYNYRQELGKAIFGETQWNKILKETKSSVTGNSNTYPQLKKAVIDLANNNKIGTAEANKFIKAMDGWNKALISTGGNLNNLMNRSGNFNKVFLFFSEYTENIICEMLN